jgi:hypothetical protein
LTVADRFGRSDFEESQFEVKSLVAKGPPDQRLWWQVNDPYRADLRIGDQEGTTVSGDLSLNRGPSLPFGGTISPDGKVHLKMSGANITLDGTMTLALGISTGNRLALTITGGPESGRTLQFFLTDGY